MCKQNAIAQLGDSLTHVQLGVGTPEDARRQHTQATVGSSQTCHCVVVKLSFTNAFNCVCRDAVLSAVASVLPDIYRFCHLTYQQTSFLRFGQQIIQSQDDIQQGDPLGPLLFCLAVHPLLSSLSSTLAFGCMDDSTLGGPLLSVAGDRSKGASLGLNLNPNKHEIISRSAAISHSEFAGFRKVTPDLATLLGALLSTGPALDSALSIILI